MSLKPQDNPPPIVRALSSPPSITYTTTSDSAVFLPPNITNAGTHNLYLLSSGGGTGGAGVASLSPGANTGNVSITSSDASITITNPSPGTINLATVGGVAGVASLSPGTNTGAVSLQSSGATITLTNPSAGVINLESVGAGSGVSSLSPGTNTGAVTLQSSSATITLTNPSAGVINLESAGGAVADGPTGAVQYSDGAGGFVGNTGLLYDGVGTITNSISGNLLQLDDGAGIMNIKTIGTGTVAVTSAGGLNLDASSKVRITAPTSISFDIAGSTGTAGQVLTADGTGVTTWSAGGSGNVADWANYPGVNNISLSNFGINIQPGSSSYPDSQMDTNLTIGKPSYTLFPNINFYPATFQVGALTAPATNISFNSLGSFAVNSAVGLALTGGGGVSIVGGGGISALGATVTVGAGVISAVGGSINLGAGTINMAGGLIDAIGTAINVGGGVITATSGGVIVTSGSVVCGTADIDGAGFICYGGKFQCATSLAGGTGGIEMNSCPLTGVSTINGSAYPPPSAPLLTGIIDSVAVNASSWTSVGTFGQYQAQFSLGTNVLLSTSIVIATLINSDPDDADVNWIVNTTPDAGSGQLIVTCAGNPTTANISIAWLITSL